MLGACAQVGEPPRPAPAQPAASLSLTPVSFARLAGWTADDQSAALGAFRRSCARLEGAHDFDREMGVGGFAGRVADWRPVCRAANGAGRAAARAYFERWFIPHLVSGLDPASGTETADGLFTGYFEAGLRGARRPDRRYRFPIYRPPADLAAGGSARPADGARPAGGATPAGGARPYASRAEIEAGALAGRGLEILWVDDAVDAFFLHIQGSGRVAMTDGTVVRLGFAGRNGRPYTAIGRELIKRGAIARDRMSMQAIRAWLAANPGEARALMNKNQSYIFFRERSGAGGAGAGSTGPVGSQGAVLTPGRSLAVDARLLPLGAPLWVDTRDPLDPAKPWRHLVIAQDTGAAIIGAVRGDIFFGFGAGAAARAGRMKAAGRYYILLPRSIRIGPLS